MRRKLSVLFFFFIMAIAGCADYGADPLSDYDRENMFIPRLKEWIIAGQYAEVELLFSVECFGQGEEPFSLGPVDWNNPVLLEKRSKTADGKHYIFSEIIKAEQSYTVSAGKDWNGQINNSSFLSGEQMAGNPYFNTATNNFSFKISSINGVSSKP